MTQHDQNIANQTFPATRADLNNALAALFSLSSGATAPTTTAAGMLWYDTANGLIKQRNAADSAWVTVRSVAGVPYADVISELTAGAGVTIDSVRCKDGMVMVAGTPGQAGEVGYASGQALLHNGTSARPIISTALISKSANYTPLKTDHGSVILCTANLTLNPSAATVGAGWECYVKPTGAAIVTITPSSGTIDGLASIKVSAQSAGFMLASDGTNFYTAGRAPEYILIQDEKTTDGGTASAGAWRTRDLNTVIADTAGNAALASNQITLQPGTYIVRASAPAYITNKHKTRVHNVTDNTTVALGVSMWNAGSAQGYNTSEAAGRFSITAAKAFEVQHYFDNSVSGNGLGVAFGVLNSVYARIELWKVV